MFSLFERYGFYVLQKAIAKHRKHNILSLAGATSVCVVLSDSEQLPVHSKKIVSTLKNINQHLKIKVCSYRKRIKDETKAGIEKSKKGNANIEILSKKDLNWYGRPKSEAMRNASCDILIDLSEKGELPLQFLAVMSNATIKIGVEQAYNKAYLHLMIQKGEEWKPEYILQQLIHYLNLINTKSNAA